MVVFKRIGNSATDVCYHRISISMNLQKIIETPAKAMQTIETYTKKCILTISNVLQRPPEGQNCQQTPSLFGSSTYKRH
jgi:hypothetical protein